MNKFIKCLEGLSERDFTDFFKEVFNHDSNLFTDIIQGSIIAQQEIAIEIEGIK
jgi:hypothetical protein